MTMHVSMIRERVRLIIVAALSYFCKKALIWNWWIGAHSVGFGLRPFIQPLLGRYMNVRDYTVTSAFMLVLGLFFGPTAVLKSLTWILPGVVAGYSLQFNSRLFNNVICLATMFLFCMHQQGGFAWTYTLYWLIPIALSVARIDTVVTRSISAAFIAHAVGSVLWLYATGMCWQLWIALIPCVAVERGLIAFGLAAVQMCIDTIIETSKRPKEQQEIVTTVNQ